MYKKLIILFILLVSIQSQIREVINSDPIRLPTNPRPTRQTLPPQNDLPSLRIVELGLDAYEYRGKVDFTNFDDAVFYYNVAFIPEEGACPKAKCYYGYIISYEDTNDRGEKQTVIGYKNQQLGKQPIFRFETNGPDDFKIHMSPNINDVWPDLIEMACNQFNPIVPTRRPSTLRVQAPSRNIASQQGSNIYNFRDITAENRQRQKDRYSKGVKEAQYSQKIEIEGIDAKDSNLKEDLIIRTDNLVGVSEKTVKLNLGDESALEDERVVGRADEQLLDLDQDIQIRFQFIKQFSFSSIRLGQIIEETKTWPSQGQRTSQVWPDGRFFVINIRDAQKLSPPPQPIPSPIGGINIQAPKFQPAEGLGKGDQPIYGNEQYTGVNVAQQLHKNNGGNKLSFATNIRTLEEVEKKTILDETKVLYNKKILGQPFVVSLRTKCDLLIYSDDVKVNCVGRVYVQYFGEDRSIEVFNILKSVSFTWNHDENFSGNWGANIWIGLPKPLKWIGLSLRIDLHYSVDLDLTGSVYDPNPYTYQVKAIIDGSVISDSTATIRVGIFEAGVALEGELVSVESDPIVRAKFLFLQKKIEFTALWKAKLDYFQAQWRGIFRRKKLGGGWKPWKTLFTKKITGGSTSWTLFDKKWEVDLDL